MSKFLHGPPKFSRGPSVVRGPPVGDRWSSRLFQKDQSERTGSSESLVGGQFVYDSKRSTRFRKFIHFRNKTYGEIEKNRVETSVYKFEHGTS
jgi:hypothetical protein